MLFPWIWMVIMEGLLFHLKQNRRMHADATRKS